MANIINAIINLIENSAIDLNGDKDLIRNRANGMGKALEEYVKDLFAGTINETDEMERILKQSEIFSYSGNQSNPPDFMIRGGDAVEVKKLEKRGSALALNSSYPKNKLYSDSKMITKFCKKCEEWNVKDIIYAVGVVGKNKKTLESLVFVYGEDFAASKEVYEKLILKVRNGITRIPDLECGDTKELGRVNSVDPLGITYLRVRGMWGVENPFKIFSYIYETDPNYDFNFMAIISEEKWNKLDNRAELERLVENTENANISKEKIKNPDNPAVLKNVYLITYKRNGEMFE
ncbi:MAG: NgoPII family restriction endonuclease [Peptoniphilus rhinitidis]|uniref:NgoPII family restriction endonuclease n=1 Tax=Peptoniphilus rhinitidis TaxID=1175452 RepID=UPI0028FFD81A|nr:NgoPII family restriction endonuclease [Peptoniphilus rhinitidis]MDU2108993.1 NgoPII family restriction endonuclease [Peptoniphilus lacydonensis]MDU3750156.1 NgoPII family restriction endonuclease [Peptoniphilus rhinitidis]